MNKILIVGCGGSGKSTLARELGKKMALRVFHLDMHFWKPGWVETERARWRECVTQLAQTEAWIMDGNFGNCADITYGAADTIIFLDRPPVICLFRWLKRFISYRNGGRPDMTEGCYEKIDLQYLKWIWNFPRHSRPKIFSRIEQYGNKAQFIRLTSDKEISNFIESVQT